MSTTLVPPSDGIRVGYDFAPLLRPHWQAKVENQSDRNMAALTNLVKRGFARQDGTYPIPLGNIVLSLEVAECALATLNGDIEPSDHVPLHPTNIDGGDAPQAACCTGGPMQVVGAVGCLKRHRLGARGEREEVTEEPTHSDRCHIRRTSARAERRNTAARLLRQI